MLHSAVVATLTEFLRSTKVTLMLKPQLRASCRLLAVLLLATSGCTKPDSIAKSLEPKGVRITRNMQNQVTAIQFNEHVPNDEELSALCAIPGVREISFSGKQISETGWDALKNCQTLEIVQILDASSGAAVKALAGHPSLTTLTITNAADVNDEALLSLAANTGLVTLRLTNTSISDAGLPVLESLTALTSLDLSGTSVSNSGVQQIVSSVPALEDLSLNATKVDATGATLVSSLTRLTKLSLRGCGLTDESLAGPAACTTLKVLDVGENPALTDAGILSLGKLSSLVSLDVSDSAFTGMGFNKAGFTSLASLKANGTQVTDAAIEDFQIPTMYSLSVERTAVSEKGVRAVFATNHQTAVAFDK